MGESMSLTGDCLACNGRAGAATTCVRVSPRRGALMSQLGPGLATKRDLRVWMGGVLCQP